MRGAGPRGALRRGLSAVRRAPLAISGAVRRFTEDPWRGRAALGRAVPLIGPGGGSPDPARAVDLAVARDDLDAAREALALLPDTDARRPSCELAVSVLAGDVVPALSARPDAQDARSRRARRTARRQARLLSRPLPERLAAHHDRPRRTGRAGDRPAILHVVTNSLPLTQAGSTVRTQGVVAAQRATGWDARVATRPGYPVLYGDLATEDICLVDGVPYHRLLPALMPSAEGVDDVYRRLLGGLADDVRPDVLHAASDHVNARAALEVGRERGIPVAYEARSFHEDTWLERHGGEAARDSDTYRWLRDRHTEVMLAADAVTTLGEAMRAEIIARGVAPERVTIAPNAVDAVFLEPRTEDARAVLGLPEAFWIGSVATLNPYEGLETLIDAAALLRRSGVDARVLLVGAGPSADALRDRASEANVPLVMPGRVPHREVRAYYDALDAFALPRTDTALNRRVTALKPLEAQARGVAVVGSDLPAVAEVLAPGTPLAPPGDASALATLLEPLVDPGEARARGEAARAWIASCRTWAQVTEAYRSAYAALGVPAGVSASPLAEG